MSGNAKRKSYGSYVAYTVLMHQDGTPADTWIIRGDFGMGYAHSHKGPDGLDGHTWFTEKQVDAFFDRAKRKSL